MEYQDYYDKFYHKVSGVTAVCTHDRAIHGEKYPLTIGKTYNVRYLAVFRSCTRLIVEGDRREYQAHCFDIFENGEPLEITLERFTSPYLLDWRIEDNYRFERIPNCLERASSEYGVRILCTALRGSRKWGYSFPKSDWDIWFLYCHKPEWYKQSNRTDAIEIVYEGNVDMIGWDIIKAFDEMKKGNPMILNWLSSRSDWETDADFMNRLKPLIPQCFDPDTAINYYYQTHIALNDIDYLHAAFPLKQFFFYLKGVLFCKWIEKKKELPPYIFKVWEEVVTNEEVAHEIQTIWYILTLRMPREDYQVSARLIEYAKEWANYYKDIALNTPEFEVSDDISRELDKIASQTIADGTTCPTSTVHETE